MQDGMRLYHSFTAILKFIYTVTPYRKKRNIFNLIDKEKKKMDLRKLELPKV